ncbi:uncharacterized protein LOC126700807 [Quercus robur]|uniref:uncharacterized protein LOC126700807 n=1 Tax=Quercus robur TaxID=38942 RepID=UPI002162751B|nr:uncharacterized protein LOC126700807 [Quercus robur]
MRLKQIPNKRVLHVYRETHQCVDALTKLGAQTDSNFVVFCNPPPVVGIQSQHTLYCYFAGRSSSRRAARATASNTPKRAAAAPPHTVPAQGQSGSEKGSLGATFASGLVWGTGAYIAYSAVNSLMGPRVDEHKTVCANQSKAFIDV